MGSYGLCPLVSGGFPSAPFLRSIALWQVSAVGRAVESMGVRVPLWACAHKCVCKSVGTRGHTRTIPRRAGTLHPGRRFWIQAGGAGSPLLALRPARCVTHGKFLPSLGFVRLQ